MKALITSVFLICHTFFIAQTIDLQVFATGLNSPITIANAGDSRLFVLEQNGKIKIINSNGTVNPTPFLDVSSLVSTGGERGLLGLAFHPAYSQNGQFFINYTNTAGNTVIARYTVNATNPNIANPTGTIIKTITQPYSNHNGGDMHFGPDGYLWISMGDGGSGGDPQNNAQNINTLLGKLLRIDVTNQATYANPADNPFVGISGEDEIWAYGLRNAWRFSFNRSNGDLWIADVGQGQWEEINKQSSTAPGLNYGWRCYEGNTAYITTGCPAQSTLTMPIAVYNHTGGRCSVTGGYVYTGSQYPALQNLYFFADFCSGQLGTVDETGQMTFVGTWSGNFAGFGEDHSGELYVAARGTGIIYKIIDSSMAVSDVQNGSVKIYPNPASDFIQIESGDLISVIYIYDSGGKMVLRSEYSHAQESVQIPVSELSPGIYNLQVQLKNEREIFHRILKK